MNDLEQSEDRILALQDEVDRLRLYLQDFATESRWWRTVTRDDYGMQVRIAAWATQDDPRAHAENGLALRVHPSEEPE